MMAFEADIMKFAVETKQNIDSAVREIVLTLGAEVDKRSPIGNRELWASNIYRASRGLAPLPEGYVGGHFRANNQYGFGAKPSGEITGEDPSGKTTMNTLQAKIALAPAAGVHYIANNVPYAVALENGHSKQAPQGIYRLAMMDVVNGIRRIVRKAIK